MSTRRQVASQKKRATGGKPASSAAPERQHSAGGRRTLWTIGGIAVAAVFVVLVVVSAQQASSPGSSASAGSTAAGAGAVGGSVTPFSLRTIDGDLVELPANRPGALFFTVSNCLTCIPSAQALAELKTRLGDRVDAVLISMDPGDPPAALRDQRDLIGDPPYPSAIDTSGTMASQYRIAALGTAVIYDGNGKIVDHLVEPGVDRLSAAFEKAGVS